MSTPADLWNPLFQPDLFHCILDCLEAADSRSVFLSLAQTCRAFSEPSLDRIWTKLDSLEPLVQCFATVWSEERAKTPPSLAEWAIIHRYSHRIRDLSVDTFSPFAVFLLQAANPSLLLPNLKTLKWFPYYSPSPAQSPLPIIHMQQLLTPSLVSLDVTLLSGTDYVTLQSFFANYPFLCPNLMSIVLDFINTGENEQVSPATINVLSRAIIHHEHLEYLNISIPIDHVTLTHIAMSPKLKKLVLALHPDKSKLHQVCAPSDMIPFRNVEHFSLDVWDLYFITLLRNQDQMFRSFVLRLRSRPTPEVVFALFTALASPQRTHSLRSITTRTLDFPPVKLDALAMGYHLTHNTFRPLTSLCHLRELVIDLGYWFSIDDDDLLSLTRNWPSLRVLHLNCERYYVDVYIWRSAKYVTFKGLLSLLECCPDLLNLCLPLDAREVPVNTGDIICNPALVFVLRFRRSRPTPEVVFALFTALASPQRTRSLRSITTRTLDSAPAESDALAVGYHLTHNTFRPLASLCHLRELVIDLGYWFSIDDDDLVSLTRNWPSLRVLHLDCQQYVDVYIWRSAKYVTFKGLLSLLECCPDLLDLCLPLDAREVPVNTEDIICNPALVHISVPRSPISDPGLVGEILSRHFPSVTRVTFPLYREEEDPEITKYIDLWNDVNTNLWYNYFRCYDSPDS